MNYYERHIGDYTRDTAHLTMLEHGAYTLLMDRYYTTERGITDEEKYKVARARNRIEKNAVLSVLKEFFILEGGEGGVWRQKRCDEVLKEYHDFLESQRAAGRASAAKRALNGGSTAVQRPFNRRGNQRSTKAQPEGNLPPPTSHLPPPTPNTHERAGEHHARSTAGSDASPEPAFEPIKGAYPAFGGGQDWLKAEHHWRHLIERGVATEPDLLAGVNRYAAFVTAGGVSDPKFVMTPGKFFGSGERYYAQAWETSRPKHETISEIIARVEAVNG